MNGVEKARGQVASIEQKIRATRKRIADLTAGRPALALQAEQGEAGALGKLDASIESANRDIANLEDAAHAARWQVHRAGEAELAPLVRTALAQWRKIRSGLSMLKTTVTQYQTASAELGAKAQELQIKSPVLPSPKDGIFGTVCQVLGIEERQVFIPKTFETLEEEAFEKILSEFARLAALPGPRKLMPPSAKDLPTGVLGGLHPTNRAVRP
jgi:hypothetical protein